MTTVVSIPGCPWCDKVKALLTMHGIEFDEQVLDDPSAQAKFAYQFNIRTFPQVFKPQWGGRIGGYEDTMRWINDGRP